MLALLLMLQQSVADSSPFRPLALPPPTAARTAVGTPGRGYWQQRADYTLQATLDTATNMLRGTGKIYYVNRSPETLDYVWVQLDQNLFAPGSVSNTLNLPPLRFAGGVVFDFSGKGFVGGITIDKFAVAGRALTTKVFGTMMRVELPRPLAPNLSVTFDVAWHFPIPPYGGGRMGRVGSRFYEMGQWYPRMAVYDDVHGWNTMPFLGAGEFYLEYGDFDVSLTLPAGFTVTATGMLANPSIVQEGSRIARAFAAPGQVVQVITRPEAAANATRRVAGTKTWRFTSSGVRDFAWAAGSGLRWDASVFNGILVQTFYHPDATPWEESNTMLRFAVRHFSGALGEYPWPQISAIEGLVEGMEYPMVIFCPSLQKREDQYWVLMHELGHQWFPMQVGSDERRYPWMDEGFNTFADYDAAEDFFKGTAYGDTVRRELLGAYAATALPGTEQPLISKPDELDGVPKAGAHAHDSARRRARSRGVRPRVQGVRATMEVQTPTAGGFLSADEQSDRAGSRLVLARMDLHHCPARSGDRLGARRERHDLPLSLQPRADGAAGHAGPALCGWVERITGLACRDVASG